MRAAVAMALLAAATPASSQDVVARTAPRAQWPTSHVRLDGMPIQGGLQSGFASPDVVAILLRSPGNPDVPLTLQDGRFVVGFDRDAPVAAELVATLAGGGEERHPLTIAPRAWRLEHVNAPYRAGRTDAEFEAIRPGELERIATARALQTGAAGWREHLRWPATGRLSGLFGAQRVYQGKPGSFHSGADIALPTGAPVVAPASGVVVLAADPARPFTLEGNLLIIDHGAGLSSAFLHLSRIHVREGERVQAGHLVGAVGATGRATGPHLHWSLRWREARLDPLLVAGPMPGR